MIKLIYFDFNFWRIDILRLSLSYSKIPYNYERIPRNDWKKRKNDFPFGQLPIMIFKDKMYSHTHSLAHFCAKKSNLYDLKIAEMNIKIESDNNLSKIVSVALRPEKILIDRNIKENSIHATINTASFVGSNYQYILNSNVGKLYVVSGDTRDIFKVGEKVFLSIKDQDVKILND